MRVLFASLVVVSLGGLASASIVTPAAFGPTASIETFEEVTPGPNVGTAFWYMVPGINDAYTFGTGISLTAPIPNTNDNPNLPKVYVINYATEYNGTWGFGGDNVVSSQSDLPYDSAFIVNQGGMMTFQFPTDVSAVGAYVQSAGHDVTMTVYDANGQVLDSGIFSTGGTVAQWKTNFFGLGNAGAIRSVSFSGGDEAVDHLMFQSVPEPAALSGMTLTALLWIRSRRHR